MLHDKSIDSLLLAIELFNRPYERGRAAGVMILLDHALEMLLKAAILHRGGMIRDAKSKNTIGFALCVKRGRSDATVKFLNEGQAITLNVINGIRDAFQHHIIDVKEEQLYFHVQSGVTLFRDLTLDVFGTDVADQMPKRVFPVATVAFASIEAFFESQLAEIEKLLQPRKRRRIQALAALRPIAILERAMAEVEGQPSEKEMEKLASQLQAGENWRTMFPGVGTLQSSATEDGYRINLRITKTDGAPVHIVPNGEGDSAGYREIDTLSRYSLTPKTMAEHLGISQNHFNAYSRGLQLEQNAEFFKLFTMSGQKHKRFSKKALDHVRERLEHLSNEDKENMRKAFFGGRRKRAG